MPFADITSNIFEDLELEAADLFKKHNLVGWTFGWDSAVRRFGVCRYGRKVISLSRKLTERHPEKALDVLKHEVAHVLAGWKTGHGPEWKRACYVTGAIPARCYNQPLPDLIGDL